jgi:hypothetical protein
MDMESLGDWMGVVPLKARLVTFLHLAVDGTARSTYMIEGKREATDAERTTLRGLL